jgi:hypothetical protein
MNTRIRARSVVMTKPLDPTLAQARIGRPRKATTGLGGFAQRWSLGAYHGGSSELDHIAMIRAMPLISAENSAFLQLPDSTVRGRPPGISSMTPEEHPA